MTKSELVEKLAARFPQLLLRDADIAVSSLQDLFLDGEFEVVVRVFDAGGVDEPELLVVIGSFGHDAVTCRTRLTRHDCLTALEDRVVQARLAHVRAAYYCYNR